MNERIKELRKALGLTQQKFAERIGVKQNTVAQYEIGRNEPTDTVLNLICREFAVNEEWLRTGEGEMFADIDRHKKIAAFLGDLMREDDSNFRVRMIEMLSELSPDEWALLEKLAKRLTSEE